MTQSLWHKWTVFDAFSEPRLSFVFSENVSIICLNFWFKIIPIQWWCDNKIFLLFWSFRMLLVSSSLRNLLAVYVNNLCHAKIYLATSYCDAYTKIIKITNIILYISESDTKICGTSNTWWFGDSLFHSKKRRNLCDSLNCTINIDWHFSIN